MLTEPDYELPASVAQPGDWVQHGLCRGMDTAIFFPTRGEPLDEARAVCAQCPVRAECLDYALTTFQKHGVWGGLSERERRARRMALHIQRQQTPADHGTRTMFARHKAAPDVWGPPCEACAIAERTYNTERRRLYKRKQRARRKKGYGP